MRPAVLLRGARKVGPAGAGHSAAPDDLFAALNSGREDLIFEIAVVQPGRLGQPQHLARLGQIARQRLLAGHAQQCAAPLGQHAVDRAHRIQAGVVGVEHPDRVDRVRGHHRLQRLERRTEAELHSVGLLGQRLAVGGGGAVYTGDLDIADAEQRL